MNAIKVTIQRAAPERLPEIREVFLDSVLYDRYFAQEGRLDGILSAAVDKGICGLRWTPTTRWWGPCRWS